MNDWYPTENDEKINDLMIQLREARAEIERLMKWQPIETAPKDSCQWILATEETCSRVDQVRWVPEGLEEGYNWVTLDGWFHPNKVFKYWMPLPEPPK